MVTEATGGLDAAGSVGGVDDPPAAVGAFGIALSLFCIVTLSTVAGTAMPFALAAARTGPGQRGYDDPGGDGHHGGGHHVRGVLAGVHAGARDVGGGGWMTGGMTRCLTLLFIPYLVLAAARR